MLVIKKRIVGMITVESTLLNEIRLTVVMLPYNCPNSGIKTYSSERSDLSSNTFRL